MPYTPKTDRPYGAIYRAIRALASRGHPFSRLDLPYERGVATDNLRQLLLNGELKIVSPAGRGRHAQPAQYAKAEIPNRPSKILSRPSLCLCASVVFSFPHFP